MTLAVNFSSRELPVLLSVSARADEKYIILTVECNGESCVCAVLEADR